MRSIAMLLALMLLSPAMANEPSSHATSAQASSTSSPKSTASSAHSANRQDLTAAEKDLLSQGYKLRIVDGKKRFCRKETVIGSNLERTVCATAAQVSQARDEGREITEQIQRNQLNPNGH